MMVTLIIVVACILLEAFCSGSEIAIVSVNRTQLRHLVEKGSKKAKALNEVLQNPEWLLGTTLLGTNLATISMNAVVTLFVIRTFGEEYEFFTLLFTTPLILFFGEVLPKAIFQSLADRLAMELVFPLKIFSYIMSPFVATVAWFAKLAVKLTGIRLQKKTPFVTREELEILLQASERGKGVKDLEKEMIDRVFSFSDQQAREIMIPLVDLVSINQQASLNQAAATINKCGYSRLPVYSGRIDNIVGWITHFDVLRSESQELLVKDIMREVPFVPGTIPLDSLLIRMQKKGESLVMLVDEYGGVNGMVTMEDVIEEVVGEIEDEYDQASHFVKKLGSHAILVNARIPIEQLNDMLSDKIPEGSYETLAGYLLTKFEQIPKKGEKIKVDNISFVVTKATKRSIEEIEITL